MKQSTIGAILVSAMFAITAIGCILISIFVQEGDTALARIGLLTAFFTTATATIILLVRQDNIEQKVDVGNQMSSDLLNGKMEAKIRAVLHDVLTERLAEPDQPVK